MDANTFFIGAIAVEGAVIAYKLLTTGGGENPPIKVPGGKKAVVEVTFVDDSNPDNLPNA